MKKGLKRGFLITVFVFGLSSLFHVSVSAAITPTSTYNDLFPDPKLAYCVSQKLSKKEDDVVTSAELDSITDLFCGYREIYSLEGMQYLGGLKNLNVTFNEISDVSPLKNLVQLESLLINVNNISDITQLSGLVNLTELDISDNKLTDLTPLKNMSKLAILEANSNKFVDVTPLANLKALTTLYLNTNEIYDITPLEFLPVLNNFSANDNHLIDISVVDRMPHVTYIFLRDQRISLRTPSVMGIPIVGVAGNTYKFVFKHGETYDATNNTISFLDPVGTKQYFEFESEVRFFGAYSGKVTYEISSDPVMSVLTSGYLNIPINYNNLNNSLIINTVPKPGGATAPPATRGGTSIALKGDTTNPINAVANNVNNAGVQGGISDNQAQVNRDVAASFNQVNVDNKKQVSSNLSKVENTGIIISDQTVIMIVIIIVGLYYCRRVIK